MIFPRLAVVCDREVIHPVDLPTYMRSLTFKTGSKQLKSLAEVEAEHIRNIVEAMQGNLTKAAEVLGIDRKTLRSKLKTIQ
jgi:two-component system response regulator HydG